MKKNKNILITGSNGQLGRCLKDEIEHEKCTDNFIFTDIEELNITDICAVSNFVHDHKVDTVINTAAYTQVDKAESESVHAFEVNANGVRVLSHICMEENVFLIHISTDYVFDGKAVKPYKPNARTNPVSVYGESKLLGEKNISENRIRGVIIRTSWLYSKYGRNFMNTMLKLGKEKDTIHVVDDQFGAPTNAHDLAFAILKIVNQADKITKPEIFHYANEGVTTWYGFAKEIMEIAQLPCLVYPVTTAEYYTPATRPAYSVLDLSKIKTRFNIQIPHWKESLQKELTT